MVSTSTLRAIAFASLATAVLAGNQKSENAPSKYRVAYHGCDGMAVSWSTPQMTSKPQIKYGTSSDSLDQTAESCVSTTYPTSSMYANHVVLSGLQPDTTYYYRVNNGKKGKKGKNPTMSFKTCKVAGDMTPYSIGTVVDLGTMGPLGLSETVGKGAANPLAPGEINTIQRLIKQLDEFEFIAHPGDIAYGDYWFKEEYQGYLNGTVADVATKYEAINEAFYDEMTPISSTKAYMMGVGNHENNCINGGYKTQNESICPVGLTNFTGYKNHWNMPSAVSGGGGGNLWYSFDYGMTHYLMFNTESDLGNGLIGADEDGGAEDFTGTTMQGSYANEQIDFINSDLASVDRSKTPWVVAMGHRPWYVAADPSDQYFTGQAAFENMFIKYGVDLVMHGHVHNCHRAAPIANNVTDPNELNNPSAPWWIVNGAAGHYDGLDPLVYPLPDYTRFANDTLYSYSKLTFHNSTHLTHEFISSATNKVIDSATLYKKH